MSLKSFLSLLLVFFFTSVGRGDTLRVVTLNTWLLEILGRDIASDILERRELIVEALNNLDADVIALQEVWPDQHRDFLIEGLSERYPYCVFDDSTTSFFKLFADGLIIFSKYPIRDYEPGNEGCSRPQNTLRFSVHTSVDELFINKGAIHVILDHPLLGSMDVYNSHLGAVSFNSEEQNYNPEHRRSNAEQASELFSFIINTRTSPYQILTVDLNRHFRVWDPQIRESPTLDPEYEQIISGNLEFVDTFMISNGYNLSQLTGTYTYDTQNNSYARDYADRPPFLADYIFSTTDMEFYPIESSVIFTEPFEGYLLSDHYAVITTFNINP